MTVPEEYALAVIGRWEALAEARRKRPEAWFDGDYSPHDLPPEERPDYHPSMLLTVLPHLRLSPGVVLDYVCHLEEFGDETTLYTRDPEGPFCRRKLDIPAESRALPGLSCEPSPLGSFDLALFHIWGGRLLLREYEDEPAFVRDRFLKLARYVDEHPPVEDLCAPPQEAAPASWAARFVPEPDAFFLPSVASRADGSAEVCMFWFDHWRGLQRWTYEVRPPNVCTMTGRETLIPYTCGIIY